MRAIRLLSLVAVLAAPVASVAQTDTRPGIAVLPFDGGSVGPDKLDLDPLKVGIQQMLITELSQNTAMRVVDRTALQALIDEQNLGASGRVDAQTAAKIGKLVGAKYVVLGGFMDTFGELRLDGRIVVVETSEVLQARAVLAKREQLNRLVVDLAGRVTEGVKLPALASRTVETRRARSVPTEAGILYGKALVADGRGEREEAVRLYRMIAEKYPQLTEASDRLKQLSTG
jgi:TolB-like protein